ncbi:hypothetical protein BIY27_22390 [Gibbsiella quercinecans]|nr:hypothetical protein BIY27_22390 [Gibbsiella quercinecans]
MVEINTFGQRHGFTRLTIIVASQIVVRQFSYGGMGCQRITTKFVVPASGSGGIIFYLGSIIAFSYTDTKRVIFKIIICTIN